MDEIIHLELADLTLRTSDPWDSRLALAVPHRIFISLELPPLTFLKVNFGGNVIDTYGGISFIITGPCSRLVAASGSHLFSFSTSKAELHTI